MARIIFQISLSFFIMTAAFSLVAAAPTQSPPAARATSQAPAAPIPESPATSFSLNQSYCSSNSIDSSFATSLCFGQWTVIKYLERALVDHEQCSNRSLPITQAVGNMQRIFCGASTAGGSSKMSLHVITSVLLTYHSVIVKAATHQASERTNSTTTEIVTEILKGLIQNYFRVIAPDHCLCTNAKSCVKTSDLSDQLDLANLTDSCDLAAYVSHHILSELRLMLTNYIIHHSCPIISGYSMDVCQQWINEYIQAGTPAHLALTSIC